MQDCAGRGAHRDPGGSAELFHGKLGTNRNAAICAKRAKRRLDPVLRVARDIDCGGSAVHDGAARLLEAGDDRFSCKELRFHRLHLASHTSNII